MTEPRRTLGGGTSSGGGDGGAESRVRESDGGDRIDWEIRSIFGLRRKIPPEKFFGGSVLMAGGGWWLPDIMGEKGERYNALLRMTKVIKGEFEKIKDVKVEDVSLTCDTSLEVFNNEVNRLSGMDDDLFTYEVEIANIPYDSKMDDDSEHEADDDMGYDPSDVAFTEWLGSKFFNYKTMDHYTMKALWIYWIRGDDEVELTDEESSDDKDEVAEVFRIDTNLFNFETPMCEAFKEFNYLLQIDPDLLTKDIEGFKTYEDYKDDWIYEWNKDVPWVDEKPWTNAGVWTKPTPVKHTCKPFNYKTGCSEWPTCSWKDDGYCNGGNLPRTYIIGNQLHYQDYEWYEALEYSELKNEALRNKAIMEGFMNEDDDELRYKQKRQWNIDPRRLHLKIYII
ncbi:hypothetical protein Tco_0755652 [Tanacetum coccineum]